MENYIIIVVLAIIIGLASVYIYRAKKKGKKCIGCPTDCLGCSGCAGCSARNKQD